jgi:hypothetical protein
MEDGACRVGGRPFGGRASPVFRATPDDTKDGRRVSNAVAGLGVPAGGGLAGRPALTQRDSPAGFWEGVAHPYGPRPL